MRSARDLIARALAETRLTQGVQHREPFLVSDLIDALAPAAMLAASAHGLTLTVPAVTPDLAIDGDRQVLSAVLMNVLQNAFKFTRPRTTVSLRVAATADRVSIEIQDECGGLPGGLPVGKRGLPQIARDLVLAQRRLDQPALPQVTRDALSVVLKLVNGGAHAVRNEPCPWMKNVFVSQIEQSQPSAFRRSAKVPAS